LIGFSGSLFHFPRGKSLKFRFSDFALAGGGLKSIKKPRGNHFS